MHYVARSGRMYPSRYFSGLSRKNQLTREKELVHRRRKLQYTDTLVKTKKSSWTKMFHTSYPNLKFNKGVFSKRFGIPRAKLDTVYNRGLRAWQTSGSRPGANPYQWAIARVYKFVLIENGKAKPKPHDPDSNLHKNSIRKLNNGYRRST